MRHFKHSRGPQIVWTSLLVLLCVSGLGGAQTSKLQSRQMTVVEYKDVSLKSVIKNLTTQLKLNVVFDESFRDQPKYDLELNDVTLESALKIVLIHKHLMARVIEDKTIIIFYDDPRHRTRFEKYPVWSAKYEPRR
ncbi:MAG: STN domain-containing protein [Acidobacteria bacterium]|nr:STN domain-containing protein [Acidobacteriota bacterium]